MIHLEHTFVSLAENFLKNDFFYKIDYNGFFPKKSLKSNFRNFFWVFYPIEKLLICYYKY